MSLIADALRAAQQKRRQDLGEKIPSPGIVGFYSLRSERARSRPVAMWLAGALVAGAFVAAGVLLFRADAPSPAFGLGVERVNPAADAVPTPPLDSGQTAEPDTGARMARDSVLALVRQAGATSTLPELLAKFALVPNRSTADTALAAAVSRPAAQPARAPAQRRSTIEIAIAPGSTRQAIALFDEGVAAHARGDLADARRAYERSIAIAPDVADAHNNLGAVFSASGDFSRATEEFRKAVTLDPRNVTAWTNLAGVFRAQQRPADAVGAYQRALQLDSANVAAKIGIAQEYAALGSVDEASRILRDVVTRQPAAAEARYAYGQVLERAGDRDGAIREYRAFLTLAGPRLASYAGLVRRHLETMAESDTRR